MSGASLPDFGPAASAGYVVVRSNSVWSVRLAALLALVVGCAFVIEAGIEREVIQAAAGGAMLLAARFLIIIAPISRRTYVVSSEGIEWSDATGQQHRRAWGDIVVKRRAPILPLPSRIRVPVYRLDARDAPSTLIVPHLLAMDLAQRRQLCAFLQRRASEARIQPGA